MAVMDKAFHSIIGNDGLEVRGNVGSRAPGTVAWFPSSPQRLMLVSVWLQAVPKLFRNPSGLPTGNAYGIAINRQGLLVNGFDLAPPSAPGVAKRSMLADVTIHGIVVNVLEVPALFQAVDGNKNLQLGITGGAIRIDEIMKDGMYVGNPLADAHFLMAKAKALGLLSQADYGTLRISSEFVAWAEGQLTIDELAENHGLFLNGDGAHPTFPPDAPLRCPPLPRLHSRHCTRRH